CSCHSAQLSVPSFPTLSFVTRPLITTRFWHVRARSHPQNLIYSLRLSLLGLSCSSLPSFFPSPPPLREAVAAATQGSPVSGVHATLLSSQTPPFLPSLLPCSPPFQHHKGKSFYLAPEGGSGGCVFLFSFLPFLSCHVPVPLAALKWFFCGDVQGKSAKSMRGGVAQGGGLPTAQHVPLLCLAAAMGQALVRGREAPTVMGRSGTAGHPPTHTMQHAWK
ncbi:unnamed protein product, partial [Closterium sp. Naga37s-1]